MSLIVAIVFFGCVFGAVATALVLVVSTKPRRRNAPGPEGGETGEADPFGEDSPLLLKRDDELSTISIWANILARFDFVEGMRAHIAQAGLNWSVGRITALMLLSGAVTWALFNRLPGTPDWAIALLAAGSAFLPYGYVLRRRAKRLVRIEEQFPDALDSLSRALRAGHPFSAGLQMLAQEAEEPLAGELRKAAAEVHLGGSWDVALDNLAGRLPLPEMSLFAAAIQLHGRTGGRLGEVLGNLAETMRESVSLRGEVRALAAHGRLSGGVLTVLPFAIAIMLTFVNPSYLRALFDHPMGKHLVAGAIGCMILAHFIIRKIVDIKL
ncbi:MAG: type II secretion system F family protein [Acidobacteriales bacterium]|nr:type II secretion system F family protein [Terriglobales bacterium]